jgi:hypothetical protein
VSINIESVIWKPMRRRTVDFLDWIGEIHMVLIQRDPNPTHGVLRVHLLCGGETYSITSRTPTKSLGYDRSTPSTYLLSRFCKSRPPQTPIDKRIGETPSAYCMKPYLQNRGFAKHPLRYLRNLSPPDLAAIIHRDPAHPISRSTLATHQIARWGHSDGAHGPDRNMSTPPQWVASYDSIESQ